MLLAERCKSERLRQIIKELQPPGIELDRSTLAAGRGRQPSVV
nr:hypothetical protein [Bradyrhizobium valentinum]